MSDAVTYRVFKLPESLLTAMREKRDEVETTNVRFLADAVDSHLPKLIEELRRLGFGVHGGDQRMAGYRFPTNQRRSACSGKRLKGSDYVRRSSLKFAWWQQYSHERPQSDDADGGQSRTEPPGRIRNAPDDNVKRTRPEMNDRHASVAITACT